MACNWGYGQRGSFSVEFALVALVIGLLLAFSSEFIARQNMQGQLQRLSFSGVSLLKERSQFYQQSGELEEDQVLQLLLILRQSLARTYAGFDVYSMGIQVEQGRLDTNQTGVIHHSFQRGIDCQPGRQLKQMPQLFVEGVHSLAANLYQVTLCYQAKSLFPRLFGAAPVLKVSSIMPGR